MSHTPETMNRMPACEEEFEYNKKGQYECKGGELLGKNKFPKCLWEDYKCHRLIR